MGETFRSLVTGGFALSAWNRFRTSGAKSVLGFSLAVGGFPFSASNRLRTSGASPVVGFPLPRAPPRAVARAETGMPARARSRADKRGLAAPLMMDAVPVGDALSRARLCNTAFVAGPVVPVLAGAVAGLPALRANPMKDASAFVILPVMAFPAQRVVAYRMLPLATSAR